MLPGFTVARLILKYTSPQVYASFTVSLDWWFIALLNNLRKIFQPASDLIRCLSIPHDEIRGEKRRNNANWLISDYTWVLSSAKRVTTPLYLSLPLFVHFINPTLSQCLNTSAHQHGLHQAPYYDFVRKRIILKNSGILLDYITGNFN